MPTKEHHKISIRHHCHLCYFLSTIVK